MIRWPLAGIAGASLALLLFWGLALLVAPPEAAVEVRETAMTMRLAAATEQPAEPAAAPVPSAPPTPSPAPPSPPPPAPLPDSPLSLPEPPADPLPVRPEAVAELDTALPELTEAAPTPEPPPEPQPEPPEPTPEPTSPPATSPEAAATPSSAAAGQEAPSADGGASQAVQDVGQATPTRRVPPSYPRRAQRRGLEGHVVVEFLIRPDGEVKAGSVRVVEARPRRVFDEAATRAVADWRFEADGRLRRARQRLEFQLR